MAEFRTNISNKEDKANKVNTISSSSTTTQYPSAKAVYDKFQPTVIEQSDDLDDCIDNGFYQCTSSTIASSLSNCPVTIPFSLLVEKNGYGGMQPGIKQTLTTYNSQPQTYIRTIWRINSQVWDSSGWQLVYEDTGWKDITPQSGFSHYSDTEQRAEYRRIGKIVYIRGAIKVGTGFTSSADDSNPIATISDTTCRPRYMHNCIQQGSGQNRWLMTVYSNGNICCSRYGTTSNTNVPASGWLNLYTTYFVD